MSKLVLPRFTLEDVCRASDEWGANCGPAALALAAGKTLAEIRPHLGDFEAKRYTNPTLMFDSLRRLSVTCYSKLQWRPVDTVPLAWPDFGLVRVQWEGPWTAKGVPMRVRYRHTHWVASMVIDGEERWIFDVNCMCVGGWVPLAEWSGSVVPWLLRECEPKADGGWHLTHTVWILPPSAAAIDEAAQGRIAG